MRSAACMAQRPRLKASLGRFAPYPLKTPFAGCSMPEGLRVTLCVDALEHQLGGIGRYTWELAQRLPSHHDIANVGYFARNRLIDDPGRLIRGEPIYPGRRLRKWARAWRARRAFRSSLVHAPNYFLPRAARTGVITVHDLSVF